MRLLIIPALVVLAIAGWSAYWFIAAAQVEAGVEQWIARQRAAGAEISHGAMTVGGYPFRLRLDIAQPNIALPARPEQPHWRAYGISAISHPWTPRHVIVDVSGTQELTASIDGKRATWRLFSGQALASWQGGDADGFERLSIDLHEAVLSENGAARLRAKRTQLHVRPAAVAEDLADLVVRSEDAEILWPLPPAFQPAVSRAELQLTVTGRPPLDAPLPQALAAWRDAGGTLEVQAVTLDWGELSMQGSGTLAVDGEMRPMGSLTAKIRGYDVLLDAARDDGQITDGATRAAKAVLGLLAAANGGMLSVPVRLQDGQAFLGPVLIARLSPLLPNP